MHHHVSLWLFYQTFLVRQMIINIWYNIGRLALHDEDECFRYFFLMFTTF